MLEGIQMCEEIIGRKLNWTYSKTNRVGDHIWWIGDLTAFQTDHPDWKLEYDVSRILTEIYEFNKEHWTKKVVK